MGSGSCGAPPAEVDGPHALYRLLEAKANRALLNIPTAGLPAAIRNLAQLALTQDFAAGEQAIVIAGTRAEDVHVAANSIDSFVQGIHVGLAIVQTRWGPRIPPDTW